MAFTTTSERETMTAAASFAGKLKRGDIVALYGDLGTGKTTFVKGLCAGFQVEEPVTSPTFVLLNRYEGKESSGKQIMIFHFDLYRISSLAEIYDLGFQEYFNGDGICVVEWAAHLKNLLPERRYDVVLSHGAGEHERIIQIEPVVSRTFDGSHMQAVV